MTDQPGRRDRLEQYYVRVVQGDGLDVDELRQLRSIINDIDSEVQWLRAEHARLSEELSLAQDIVGEVERDD